MLKLYFSLKKNVVILAHFMKTRQRSISRTQ